MNFILKYDRTAAVEFLSGAAFLLMAAGLSAFSLRTPDNNHYLFWITILTTFSFLQLMSVILRDDLYFLRLVMAWVSGVTWVWVAYSTLNSVIAMPIFCIGIANLYAFSKLGINIADHIEFLNETRQNASNNPTRTD